MGNVLIRQLLPVLCRGCLCLALGLGQCLCPGPGSGGSALAAPPPWPDASFTYLADNQKLTEVLSRFARSFGLEIQLTEQVRANDAPVSGRITTANPGEFLNQMGAAYGLSWFVQNGVLYISRSSERTTQAIVPPGISSASLKSALIELGVIENKFGWGEIPDRGMALVSGPPAYVRLVAQVVSELPAMAADQQVQVFRLRHAPVDDRTIFFRDRQIVTAGIASILTGLVNGDSSASGTNVYLAELAAPLRSNLPPLTTLTPLAGASGEAGNTVPSNSSGAAAASASGAGPRRTNAPGTPLVADRPVIQADSRLNSVIIRDRPERMPIYRELISLLDVPTQLIEIEAMIVDVNSSEIQQLGIDWGARVGNVTANVTAGGPLSEAATAATINIGGSSTVIANLASSLMARINALESKGNARIMSRPSVLTMDNLGALIDLSETFYIQSVGERVSSVTPISVGVTLKVTPHVVEENGRRLIQLVVDIEDGAIQDRQVQNLPTVRRSIIGTQAVMGERESLLIGGFNSEQTIRQKDGIPVLGNLPFVGPFFSKKSTTGERRERLFVITPKIVTVDGQVAQSGALRQGPPAAQQGRAANDPQHSAPAGSRGSAASTTAVPTPTASELPAPASLLGSAVLPATSLPVVTGTAPVSPSAPVAPATPAALQAPAAFSSLPTLSPGNLPIQATPPTPALQTDRTDRKIRSLAPSPSLSVPAPVTAPALPDDVDEQPLLR